MHAISAAPRASPRFWIVGGLSLLWSLFGGFDYIMTNIRNPGYVAQIERMTPGMMDFIDGFPVWALAAWTLGVWGAVVGSVLLLTRSRLAVYAFAASLIGLTLSSAYQYTAERPASLKSPANDALTAVIWAIAVFLLWYAVRMRNAEVLRPLRH